MRWQAAKFSLRNVDDIGQRLMALGLYDEARLVLACGFGDASPRHQFSCEELETRASAIATGIEAVWACHAPFKEQLEALKVREQDEMEAAAARAEQDLEDFCSPVDDDVTAEDMALVAISKEVLQLNARVHDLESKAAELKDLSNKISRTVCTFRDERTCFITLDFAQAQQKREAETEHELAVTALKEEETRLGRRGDRMVRRIYEG